MRSRVLKNFIYKLLIVVICFYLGYLCILPAFLSNEVFINKICGLIEKKSGYIVQVDNLKLKTFITPKLEIKADSIKLINNEESLFETKKLNLNIGYGFNKIKLNSFLADYIYVNVNNIVELLEPKNQKKSSGKAFQLDFYNAFVALKKSKFMYKKSENVFFEIDANANLGEISEDIYPIKFDINAKIINNDDKLNISFQDKNKVYIKDKRIYIENCPIKINSSEILVNSILSNEDGLNLNLSSRSFDLKYLHKIIVSNLIIKNGKELLSCIKDFGGKIDFNLSLNQNVLNGDVYLKGAQFKLIPLNNIPISITQGKVSIKPNDIKIADVCGFYGKSSLNDIKANGSIKNNQTNIVVKTKLNNEFAKKYLSQVVGVPIEIVGKAGTQLVFKNYDNKIEINLASRLQKGDDILLDGMTLSPKEYDRAINSAMELENNTFKIKNIDYYISETIDEKSKIKPILTADGIIDMTQDTLIPREIGLNIPEPLPSEFLNLFAGKGLFRKGEFQGNIRYLNYDNNPKILGKFKAKKIFIPSQKLYLREGVFVSTNEFMNLIVDGRFKRSEFDFKGKMLNRAAYPFVIKNLELAIDYIDIEKMFNTLQNKEQNVVAEQSIDNLEEGKAAFDLKNVIVEDCVLKLSRGKYKDIDIANLDANLTFDSNQNLTISARRFNIAEGISSLKILGDLKNGKYNLKLVAKDVNSDKMATSLLNLKKEISGKASGFINLYTDNTKKLGGEVKFSINNGCIQKVGLAEYLMKFASIFRNPLVMISPSIIADIVNIPEGEFDRINGEMEIKDNIIHLIRIKSASPTLSSYIVGMYNLENNDAILRIYTKFSKKSRGLYGFLRDFSLNSLANKFLFVSNTDINYYASEISQIPTIESEEDSQIFLTKIDGDIYNNNFISSLKKIK